MIIKSTRTQLFDWIKAGMVELESADTTLDSMPPGDPDEGLRPDSIVFVELPDKYGRGSMASTGAITLVDEVRAISAVSEGLTRELGAQLRNLGEGWLPVSFRPDMFRLQADVVRVADTVLAVTGVDNLSAQAQELVSDRSTPHKAINQSKEEVVHAATIASTSPENNQETTPGVVNANNTEAMAIQATTAQLEATATKNAEMQLPAQPAPSSSKPKAPERANNAANGRVTPKARTSRKKPPTRPALLLGEEESS